MAMAVAEDKSLNNGGAPSADRDGIPPEPASRLAKTRAIRVSFATRTQSSSVRSPRCPGSTKALNSRPCAAQIAGAASTQSPRLQ